MSPSVRHPVGIVVSLRAVLAHFGRPIYGQWFRH